MFQAPTVLTAEIFARVPECIRKERPPITKFGTSRDCYLEGPSFDRQGNLYCVDIDFGRVLKVDAEGNFEVIIRYDGAPNGLKIHKDGRIFITDHRKGLLVLDPTSRKLETFLSGARGEPFKGLNDLVFASNGDLYFTDQGNTGMQDPSGRVYRKRHDGPVEMLLSNVPSPNGVAVSPDGKNLFIAATRSNSVWNMPLEQFQDGAPTRVGTFVHMNGGSGPDGLAVSNEGHLLVAHVGFGAVWVFTRRGEPTIRIESPLGHLTTNLAFGGTERKTLYITESSTGTILRAELPMSGTKLYSHVDE